MCGTGHDVAVLRCADSAVVVGRLVVALVVAAHRHAAHGDVVFLCEVPRQAHTAEESAAAVVALAIVALILARLQVLLFALRAAATATGAVANVAVGLDDAAAVIQVSAGVPAALRVDAGAQRTVVAGLAVALQDDVDDAGRTFGRELRRRVVDDFHAFDALGGNLLQDVVAVVAGHARCLAVDPHLDAAVAAQRYFAVGSHLDAGNLF